MAGVNFGRRMVRGVTMRPMDRGELVDRHLLLLELERIEEEYRQNQLNQGKETTLKLVIYSASIESGAHVLTLRPVGGNHLPKHCIHKGSRVKMLRASVSTLSGGVTNTKLDTAVVTGVTPDILTIVFSYDPDAYAGQLVCVLKDDSSIENEQLQAAMRWVKSVRTDQTDSMSQPVGHLVRLMFGEDPLEPAERRSRVTVAGAGGQIQFINQRLDASQRQAVEFTLRQRRLAIIHGPPGTGKTTTVVEVILQHVRLGQRVLVCAPSNTAVDNMLEGLWKLKKNGTCELKMEEVIRLGHLARMDEKNRYFSLNIQVKKRLSCYRIKLRYKDRREKEIAVKTSLLQRAAVVLTTLSGVRTEEFLGRFDLLVIDECAQATEAACWLAIPLAKKVLLSGDPCQLPPTILSQEAARQGLAVSLMERQMALLGKDVVHMLDTQYRMHELIQAWSSRYLYGGRLKASPLVGRRLLTDLEGVRSTDSTRPTLLLVDTAGGHLPETCDNTSSYRNHGEADLVVAHAESLIKAGLPAQDIGVITPYKQQVELIADEMRQAKLEVEVNSVDGYQGREKEAVLLSLVRSNEGRRVGFVKDHRRLNVAVTRARRQLCIVCDTDTVCNDKTIRSLVNHMEQRGDVRSAYYGMYSRGERSAAGGVYNGVSNARVPTAYVPEALVPTTNVLSDGHGAFVPNDRVCKARVLTTREFDTRSLTARAPEPGEAFCAIISGLLVVFVVAILMKMLGF